MAVLDRHRGGHARGSVRHHEAAVRLDLLRSDKLPQTLCCDVSLPRENMRCHDDVWNNVVNEMDSKMFA